MSNTPVVDTHAHWLCRPVFDEINAEAERRGKVSLSVGSDLTRTVNKRQIERVRPMLSETKLRLEAMDRQGVDVQLISSFPPQMYYWLDPETAERPFRLMNELMAETVAEAPDRLVGMGNVPLQQVDLAIEELDNCMDALGFKGVQIATRVEGEDLHVERLRPFWQRVEELGAVVFIHTNGHDNVGRLDHHYMINVVGHPIETTLAASHLIFGGVLERFPNLKIVLAHGGGYLPAYAGRMDHAYREREDVRDRLPSLPGEYLRRLYFDTIVHDDDQLRYLLAKYGPEHIVLGTDYPFDMGDEDPLGTLGRATQGNVEQHEAVAGGNAVLLYGLEGS